MHHAFRASTKLDGDVAVQGSDSMITPKTIVTSSKSDAKKKKKVPPMRGPPPTNSSRSGPPASRPNLAPLTIDTDVSPAADASANFTDFSPESTTNPLSPSVST